MRWRAAIGWVCNVLRKIEDESGQALILFALGFVVFCGMVALSFDVGSLYMEKQNVKSTADAMAISVASDIAAQIVPPTYTQPYVTPQPTVSGTWQDVALQTADRNDKAAVYTVSLDLTNRLVIVNGQEKTGPWFAKVLGFGKIQINQTSEAHYGPLTQTKGLVPIGFTYTAMQNTPSGTVVPLTFDPGNATTPGNYGYVSFDQSGTSTLTNQILQGSSSSVSIGEQINSETGTPGPATQAALCRLEAANGTMTSDNNCEIQGTKTFPTYTTDPTQIAVPIIDNFPSSGSSGTVTVVGFAVMQLISVCESDGTTCLTGSPNDPKVPSGQLNIINAKFIQAILPGQTGSGTYTANGTTYTPLGSNPLGVQLIK